jgi:hypothetical protein
MTTEVFYATVGGVAFTLHGLWWVVVQSKREWQQLRSRRLLAYVISLHFLLPGMMSLLSIVAPDVPILWRAVFTTAGCLGIAGVLLLLRALREEHDCPAIMRAMQWLVLPIYVAITILALFPTSLEPLGLQLKPIQVEAIIVSFVLLFGVQSAWILMVEPVRTPTGREGAGRPS